MANDYFSLFGIDMDCDGKVSWIDDALYLKFFIDDNKKPAYSEDTYGTNHVESDDLNSFDDDDDFDED